MTATTTKVPQPTPRPFLLADGSYVVPSRTRVGRVHHVQPVKGLLACDCEAGQFGRTCWAIRAVEATQQPAAAY